MMFSFYSAGLWRYKGLFASRVKFRGYVGQDETGCGDLAFANPLTRLTLPA